MSSISSEDLDRSVAASEQVLLELAHELRRLANGLTREIRRGATLPGLSNLTAMEPVQRILTQSLSARLFAPSPDDASSPSGVQPAGYL